MVAGHLKDVNFELLYRHANHANIIMEVIQFSQCLCLEDAVFPFWNMMLASICCRTEHEIYEIGSCRFCSYIVNVCFNAIIKIMKNLIVLLKSCNAVKIILP